MAKTWVLDTETKGTGAHVVPLEDARPKRPPAKVEVPRKPRPRPQPAPEPRRPRARAESRQTPPPRPPPAPEPRRPPRFKVVDVMTRATLAEDVDGRAL